MRIQADLLWRHFSLYLLRLKIIVLNSSEYAYTDKELDDVLVYGLNKTNSPLLAQMLIKRILLGHRMSIQFSDWVSVV